METLHYPRRPHVLTDTALGRMRSCERKYYLRNVVGIRSRFRSSALGLGSAWHEGIHHLSPGAAGACIRGDAEIKVPEGFVDEALEERCIVAETMVAAAPKRFDDWPERREVPFRFPVFSPKGYPSRNYDMAGVVDGWPSDLPGSFWHDKAGEWKTTSRLNSDYILGLQTRSQPMAYAYACSRILGRPIRTVVYRIIQKPTIKRRTKRSPETLEEFAHRLSTYYDERPELIYEEWVTFTDEQIQDWVAQMWEVSRRANDIRRGKSFPIMNDQSCVTFWRCEFLDLCARSVTTEAYETIEDFHPEITAALAAEGESNG